MAISRQAQMAASGQNPMDADSLDLLESFVNGVQGAVALVSHDREFLRRVVTDVAELDEFTHGLTVFSAAYVIDQRPFACAASAFNDGTPCISADRRQTQAPTLCEGWNTRDLLAHMLVRRWRSSQRGLAAPASSALPGRALSSVST